ncbi:hypothetical protein E1267_10880 [Nonomuraea longispora]|uniref:Uncharacterized protein n=1 Tax=Nonomuraea longispora TaxID=1848320 RepID=A0A4V2XKY1_9ACTN|nr:hypothetical protein [Nonomuraea longispora]TDC08256.1 hypothetical protein E1267_10880 [Nonomuraea longispora]
MDIIIMMISVSAVLAGGVTYAVTRRDLRGGARVAVALACAVLVGGACLFVPWLPLFAFLGTVVVHLVVRRLLTAKLALAASGVVLVGGCSFCVLLMMMALETM